jgi:hypothetical protein
MVEGSRNTMPASASTRCGSAPWFVERPGIMLSASLMTLLSLERFFGTGGLLAAFEKGDPLRRLTTSTSHQSLLG